MGKGEKGREVKSTLSRDELERYSRQILFKQFGREGQERLKASCVLVAGIGGLGSPVTMYLVSGGIGRITLVDSDAVSLSNLNRQLLHWEEDMGKSKVDSAGEKLVKMNSAVHVERVQERITPESCKAFLKDVDVVIDCLDNMETRYVLNRECVKQGLPLIHGGVYGMMGQLTTIIPGKTPCLECIFPVKDEEKGTIPIFGPTAGFIASLQVLEVIKLLTDVGEIMAGKLLYFNGEIMECILVEVKRREDCPVCGKGGGV